MGQAKWRKWRKTLPEGVPHEEAFTAYKNWCEYCNQIQHWTTFDNFLGCTIEWDEPVVWCHPRIAKKIRMLNSPHYYVLLKAYYARRK